MPEGFTQKNLHTALCEMYTYSHHKYSPRYAICIAPLLLKLTTLRYPTLSHPLFVLKDTRLMRSSSSSSSAAHPDIKVEATSEVIAVGEKRPRGEGSGGDVVKGLFDSALGPKAHIKSEEELANLYTSAVESHPFVDRSHYSAIIDSDAVVRDTKGNVVCVLLKNSLPEKVSDMAANVLRGAPTRTSLRSSIFGGESPLSGIAGYYDYSGSPVELKCRKTSFTYEHVKSWPAVFPMISYVSQLYKEACPKEWQRQNEAIPDVVRLRDSPFSTLTINQRFRTARHTDAGDFDEGMGVLAVLEGNYEGLHLGMPDFGVCFRMQPRDVLLFDTHHFHCNTELELPFKNSDWDRLTCVFYYRTQLGESNCVSNYRRRLEEAMDNGNHDIKITKIEPTDNGVNSNVPSPVHRATNTPFGIAASMCVFSDVRGPLEALHNALAKDPCRYLDVLGEKALDGTGIPPRTDSELVSMLKQVRSEGRVSERGGFQEAAVSQESIEMKKGLLSVKSLSQVLPPQLCTMYEDSKKLWLAEVGRSWKHQISLNPHREDFSWSNVGALNQAFFDLCDVAQQVMIYLLGNEHPSKAEEAAFWFCFASSMHDFTLQEPLLLPPTAMSMKKLNVKLKDYSFGGTRYFKDQSEEEQQRRLLRKKRILEARKAGQEDEEELTVNWLLNDEYDYQEEDTPVDYASLGVPPADENPSLTHARQARTLMDKGASGVNTQSTSPPTSILHVVPDPDPHYYRKLLATIRDFCEMIEGNDKIKKEAERLIIGCKTTQLWCNVARMKNGLPNSSSPTGIPDLLPLFTKLAENEASGTLSDKPDVAVKLADVGNINEQVVYVSEALSAEMLSKRHRGYDVVILHHLVSTAPPHQLHLEGDAPQLKHPVIEAVSSIVTPLSRLSKSATLVLESDRRDACHSQLSPLLEVPFMRAVGPSLNIAGGLKAASGIVPRPSIVTAIRNETTWVSAEELRMVMGGQLPTGCDGTKRVIGGSPLAAAVSQLPPPDITHLGTVQFKRSPQLTVCHLLVSKSKDSSPAH